MDDWDYPASPTRVDGPGIHWYRAIVILNGHQSEFDVLALLTESIVSAYDMYWDGKRIGQNGIVADAKKEEVPGVLKTMFSIQREYTLPEQHVLAMRVSNHHVHLRKPIGGVRIGYRYYLNTNYAHKGSHFLFVGGAWLITGLFCLALFFSSGRHRSYLLFAIYCFISLFFDVYPIYQLYNDIQISNITWIQWLLLYGEPVSMFVLVIFVLFTFDIPHKKNMIPVSILLFLLTNWIKSFGYDYHIYYLELLPTFTCGLLVYAVIHKKTGSIAALTGLVLWRLSQYMYIIPVLQSKRVVFYMLGDVFFLFSIVVSISRTIHVQNQLLQKIELRSSRLEVDLLKKNIQPHFILNTLQSIMNWIKKKPENAVHLIEALAEEFRLIHRISDQKLIPLHQEIDLCKTHLKIMGFRMGTSYKLVTEGLCDHETVPPLVFHTLIENALTHSFKTKESGVIRLSCQKENGKQIYQLSNNGSRLKEIAGKADLEIEEGMGIQYIKARLKESYNNNWKMNYQLDETEWVVRIELKR